MISKSKSLLEKMLRHFLIFGLLFVAIHADGKFAVLQSPDSLVFQGDAPVRGADVADIVLASTGNPVYGDSQWSGLSIVDPFRLPTKTVLAMVEGVSIDMKNAQYEFPLKSSGLEDSVDMLVSEMKSAHTSTCDVDFRTKQVSKASHKCFGIAPSNEKPALPSTKALSVENAAAKKFLTGIADLNDAIDSYLKLKESKSVEPKSFIIVRMSLGPIVQEYGADSAELSEAVELVENTLKKLQKATGDALYIAISSTSNTKTRAKRQTVAEAKTDNPFNLSKYYDSEYPVIFNIILWFMIVFGLSLLAISYAIGSMDPGKDSIIYRMTSTRMKKDN